MALLSREARCRNAETFLRLREKEFHRFMMKIMSMSISPLDVVSQTWVVNVIKIKVNMRKCEKQQRVETFGL